MLLDRFFTTGAEILVANNADEAITALQLTDHELRRIAHQARERVLAEHTSAHRVEELERLLIETHHQTLPPVVTAAHGDT